jgi:hypothetical protein
MNAMALALLLLLWQFHIAAPPGMKLVVTIDSQPAITADSVAITLVPMIASDPCRCANGIAGGACAGPGMLLTGNCVTVQEFDGLTLVPFDQPTPIACDDMVVYSDPELQAKVHIDLALKAARIATGTCAP